MTAIDRALLFNNPHDRPIPMECLRGTLFGQRTIADGQTREATITGNGVDPLDRGTNLDDHADDIARMAAEGNPHHDNDPTRLYVPLEPEEITALASDLTYNFDRPVQIGAATIHPESIGEEDRRSILAQRDELAATDKAPEVEAANIEAAELLPGGIRIPEGYRLVGKVSYDDETGRIEQECLRPTCSFTDITPAVSATLQRPEYGSPHGVVTMRVIHDGAGVAYLFRKDEGENTYFRVAFGHGVSA